MKEFNYPVFGASPVDRSAMCSVCKSGLRWQGGKPVPILKRITAIIALAALGLSVLSYTTVLLIR